jgi:PAS domain S-box-containing protein
MIGASTELGQEYGSALGAFLSGGGETDLKRAYDLGRRAVNEGVGLLTMVLLHQQAVKNLLERARPPSRPRIVDRAMDFLAECLAPFEMAHRGFQDAYARLRELNEEVETVVAERTRELRNAEARYRAHVEQIPAITYIESIKTRDTVYVSPQIEAALGFSPQEWLGDPGRWAKQIHPDDRDRILAEMSRFRESGSPLRTEYRLLTRDGRDVWVRHDTACVRDEAGRPQFIQGVLLDITDRKRAEKTGRESEARFRRVFAESGDAMILATLADRKILDANARASRLSGVPGPDLLARSLPDLFAGAAEKFRTHADAVRDKGAAGPDPFRIRNGGGSNVPVELSSSIVEIDGLPCMLCILREVPERRK